MDSGVWLGFAHVDGGCCMLGAGMSAVQLFKCFIVLCRIYQKQDCARRWFSVGLILNLHVQNIMLVRIGCDDVRDGRWQPDELLILEGIAPVN